MQTIETIFAAAFAAANTDKHTKTVTSILTARYENVIGMTASIQVRQFGLTQYFDLYIGDRFLRQLKSRAAAHDLLAGEIATRENLIAEWRAARAA